MFRSTIVALVLLRLAIGWHFFFEGLEKIRTMRIGQAEISRPFSSAGYFREAPGPLGGWMRSTLGDPYEEARARLVLKEIPELGRLDKPADYMPPALNQDWDDYFKHFVSFYGLTAEQEKQAATRLQQAKSNLVTWLHWNDRTMVLPDTDRANRGIKKVKKVYPGGEIEVESTVPERVADYLAALDDVRRTQTSKLWYFGKDVEKQRLLKAKADLEQKRADLMKDLDVKTADMKKSLADVLTPEQKEKGEVPAPAAENRTLTLLDQGTAYGLTIMGGCLILGFLTRINSVLLAGFLLMTYLAVPPFPWLPVPPNNEGSYYYVNKNLIEMLALLVLATVPSGRWLGLDALLHAFKIALFGETRQPAPAVGRYVTYKTQV